VTWTTKHRRRALAALACGALAVGWLPASAGPSLVPPACNPTVSGVAMPGCPSTLLSSVDAIQHPSVAFPDLSPDVTEVFVTYDSITFDDQTGQWTLGSPILNFNTLSQNLGRVPLDLQADNPTEVTGSTVSQCVSWSVSLVCRQREQVGGFVWHDEHKHYHFQDFASYELRRLLPDGSPDFTASGLISTSPKVSFCLVDSTKVRDDAVPVGRYNTCNPVEEGISPGWADEYPSGLEGQTLALNGVTDGRYALVIAMNAGHHVWETNTANNRIVALIKIDHLGAFSPEAQILDKALM
jgi:hypothetical protein